MAIFNSFLYVYQRLHAVIVTPDAAPMCRGSGDQSGESFQEIFRSHLGNDGFVCNFSTKWCSGNMWKHGKYFMMFHVFDSL